MAQAATGRHGKIVVGGSVHPEYRQILATYLNHQSTEVVTVPARDGGLLPAEVEAALDDHTACLLVQQPNFLGCLEEVAPLGEIAHRKGAAFVVAVDPISLGILRRPGDYGADIVVAEGQGLGNYMSFGGPYLGILACREEFVRRMPGRIAGQTVDRQGQRCWVLTLQTREQHIRREKATSNICTNQGLLALRASIYLALLGPQGLRETAELCLQKARYAAARVSAGGRCAVAFDRPTFKEFVVRDREGRVAELLAWAAESGYFAGVPLGRWYPELADCFLVAVTEKRSREEIDGWAAALAGSKRGAVERRAVVHA
jgi:glycine dehydrogenase subunit 1